MNLTLSLSLFLQANSEAPSDFILFLGRFHPMVVHLPIGILLLAAIAEFLTRNTKFEPVKPFVKYIWGFGVLGALLAVVFGYFLSLSGDYNEDTVFWHKWSGVGVLIISLCCYYISKKQIKIPFYGRHILVSIVVIAIFYTGHLGGNLTHGSTYLLEYAPNTIRNMAGMPDKVVPRKKVTVLDSAHVYLDLINPIMNSSCVSCHNQDKKKGDLDLSSFANLMKGGENGEVIVLGNATASDIYRRITLPETHDDFMPTDGKPPLSEEEVKMIGWWITSGAPSNEYFLAMNPDGETKSMVEKYLGLDKNQLLNNIVKEPKEQTIEALVNQGFIINRLMLDNNFIEANYSLSEDAIDQNSIETLLQIKEQLIWLNLSNSEVTNEHLKSIGQLENLLKLNLSNNQISDDGLLHLEKLSNLESLNLYNTSVSSELVNIVPKLTRLKRLYLSESNATSEIVSQLQKEHKNLDIIFDKLL